MTDETERPRLRSELEQILAQGHLSKGAQDTARRLIRRLVSDIHIVLLGPDAVGAMYLHDVLQARALPRTDVRIVRFGSPFQFEQADMCIWCTTAFREGEALFWEEAPDRLKDHSFLVPISDPAHAPQQFAPAQLDALGAVASEDFYGLFPVVMSPDARGPQTATVDALLEEVAQMVRRGLAADSDNARMFVEIHRPKDMVPTPLETLPPERAPVATTPPEVLMVYQSALEKMHQHIKGLAPFASARTPAEFSQVLSICEAASSDMAEVFSATRLPDPEFKLVKEDVLSAADTVLLLSIEGGCAPTTAAVTTLLQLRREMEMRIAC